MTDYPLNDPRLEALAKRVAAGLGTIPFEWRLRDEQTLVIILQGGAKITYNLSDPFPDEVMPKKKQRVRKQSSDQSADPTIVP